MSKKLEIKWLSGPGEYGYPAALSYLSLIYDMRTATAYVEETETRLDNRVQSQGYFPGVRFTLLGAWQFPRRKGSAEICRDARSRLCC